MNNLLIRADNLTGMRYLLDTLNLKNKVDLVYIDPPFATGDVFLTSKDRSSTISRAKDGEVAYTDALQGEEYLEFLRTRLLLLRELLSERGSIYLHIDYKIGHYVKVLMDEVFGVENFRNDISRVKCNPKNFARVGFGNVKDLILFYSKSTKPIWREPKTAYSDADVARLFPKKDENGRAYTTVPIHAPGETKNGKTSMPFKGMNPPKGRHWRADVETLEEWDAQGLLEWSSRGNPRKKIFADEQEGKRVQDIWEFKDPPYPVYPTEKNLDMLKLIVATSSDENSVVLDAFCGSGTTLKAAQFHRRTWIGIDSSEKAIEVTRKKLGDEQKDLFSESRGYDFIDLHNVG